MPEVISAQRLFDATTSCVGAADLAVYQRIYDEHVGTLPGVHRLSSNLVMKEAVHIAASPDSEVPRARGLTRITMEVATVG